MNNNFLTDLYTSLYKNQIISDVVDITDSFNDEPPIAKYVSILNPELNYYNKNEWKITPTGTSFYSREVALKKCLIETFEKMSLFLFNETQFEFFPYDNNVHDQLNLQTYLANIDPRFALSKHEMEQPIAWVKGYNLSKKREGYIPAQLVYPNYGPYSYYEQNRIVLPLVNVKNAYVGSAGGVDKEGTILRAIYEHIERESRFCFFNFKPKPKRLEINKQKNKSVNSFLSLLKSYGFEVYLFNIMNDVEIPVIMTLLIDMYGKGQVINTGFYSSARLENAIIGSMEDALYQRFFYRYDITQNTHDEKFIKKRKLTLFNHTFNSEVFIDENIYNSLNFIFSNYRDVHVSNFENKLFIPSSTSTKDELQMIILLMQKKGFDIWYTEMSIPHVDSKDICLYKVLIPGLQPAINGVPVSTYYQERYYSAINHYKNSKYYV